MRMTGLAVGVLALAVTLGCNKESKTQGEASASASAQAEAKVELGSPRIGGVLSAVGGHRVELALYEDGKVEGLVLDADGKALANAKAAKLDLVLSAEGGAKPKVSLSWDAPKARFVGDAKAKLVAKPIDISLEVDGKTAAGKLEQYALLSAPRFGGRVMAIGNLQGEVVANPTGQVQAFITTASGAKLDANAKASVAAEAGAKFDAKTASALAWDAPHACFAGKLSGGAGLRAKPFLIGVTLDGKTHVGGFGHLTLAANAGHGGVVLVAGDFSVELVADGKAVTAYVFDASGKAHVAGDLDLKLGLGVDGKTELALKWDAPSLSYRGELAADVDLETQPIRVAIQAGGRLHVGGAASLKALAKARLDANADLTSQAKLEANAKLSAEAPKVKAKAGADLKAGAKAGANVKVPKPSATLNVKKKASAGNGKAKAGISGGFSFGAK